MERSWIVCYYIYMKRIVIVGGGFGGVRCALDCARKGIPDTKIILVTDRPHFEYHAALYRVVTGRSPLEVCIPLAEIFKRTDVEISIDTLVGADLKDKRVTGQSGSQYAFDFLVLALGSETVYFDIPGLKELAYGFKSINAALRLKRHLHEIFSMDPKLPLPERVMQAHLIVVGGGASGTELAGELAAYIKKLSRAHGVPESLVTLDLIEAAPRLLSLLPEDVSLRIKERLHALGVNVFLNRVVVKEEVEKVYLKDMEMRSKTLIWSAGVKPNKLFATIAGLTFDKKGAVVVDHFLQAQGFQDVFVLGDAAATPYTGMAQTALEDGRFAAKTIAATLTGKGKTLYVEKKPVYAVPVGPGWAAVLWGRWRFYGCVGWIIRRFLDFRFFLSILSFSKALLVFRSGKRLSETCPLCSKDLGADV